MPRLAADRDPKLLTLLPPRTDLRGGVVPGGEVDRRDPDGSLLVSWERSRRLGADPDGRHALGAAVVADSEVREACERTDPVWRRARNVMEDFVTTCARRDFLTLLTDRRGIVTHALGGGSFRDEGRHLNLIRGAAWGENLRGTNAIGTALAERRPVAVHGAAHFARVNQELVCYAAPIRDPYGEIVAVLDATSRAEQCDALDGGLVLTVARAIEEILRLHAYGQVSGGVELVERLIERSAGPAFLVENPGRVVRSNAQARQMVGRHRDGEGFLPDWAGLVALAAGDRHGVVGNGPEAARLTVEPILQTNGELLALLVLVDPVETLPSASQSATLGSSKTADPFSAIVGTDPVLVEAREKCARLARSRLPILLLAETGSGKELFARAIQEASPLRDGPYVTVNCGAIQPDLLLSELFGHGPGAFTGAHPRGRDGLLAAANGGTLFLDEVAELSVDAQVALLRVLEDGSYTRVGETGERRVDLRILAATSRDLRTLVAEGKFRQDLFFRIGGACIELPRLRCRNDIHLLVDALWRRETLPSGARPPELGEAACSALVGYPWPGNVRELESALEFAAVMAEGSDEVEVHHLPLSIREEQEGPGAPPAAAGELDIVRRSSLVQAFKECGGNISAVARRLGVARSTVYRMARRYGLRD